MPIDFACQACGKRFSLNDELAGRRGKCSGCGAIMRVPSAPHEVIKPRPEVPSASPSPARERSGPDPLPVFVPSEAGPTQNVQVVVNQVDRRSANGLGVTAVILGAIALVICWVPLMNLLVIPLVGIAGLLAVIGLILALTNKRSGIAWPLTGIGLNLAAFVGMLVLNVVYAGATGSALNRAGTALKEARVEQDKKEAALKNDPRALMDKAISATREAAAKSYGSKEAKEATIAAERSGIKEFGESSWEVTGAYLGVDEKGIRFKAPWTARISWMFGSFQCTRINMGDHEDVR